MTLAERRKALAALADALAGFAEACDAATGPLGNRETLDSAAQAEKSGAAAEPQGELPELESPIDLGLSTVLTEEIDGRLVVIPVKKVVVNYYDGGERVIIVEARDGRYFLSDPCGSYQGFYPDRQSLAMRMWSNGDPGLLYRDVLLKAGWLTLGGSDGTQGQSGGPGAAEPKPHVGAA